MARGGGAGIWIQFSWIRGSEGNPLIWGGWRMGGFSLPSLSSLEAEFLNVIGTKVFTSFPSSYSQSPLLTDFTSPTPWSEVVRNIAYGNLKSENSQDYAQKPQRNFTVMNSDSDFLIYTNHNKTFCFRSHCAFPSQRTTKTGPIKLLLLQRCYCTDDYSDVVDLERIHQLPSLLLRCCFVAYHEFLLLWYGAL
jgi:hypothetical protein